MNHYIEPYITADNILHSLATIRNRMSITELEPLAIPGERRPNNVRAALKQLVSDGFIEVDGVLGDWYLLKGEGAVLYASGGYKKKFENEELSKVEENRIKGITNKKLEIDLANAENVYKTYKFTRFAAIFGFSSGIILLLLKLAEVLGWLPLRK